MEAHSNPCTQSLGVEERETEEAGVVARGREGRGDEGNRGDDPRRHGRGEAEAGAWLLPFCR